MAELERFFQDFQDFITPVRKNAECCICYDILQDPVKTPCDHMFCSGCMQALLDAEKSTKAPCPLCKSVITKRCLQKSVQRTGLVHGLRQVVSALKEETGFKFIGESFCKTPKRPSLSNASMSMMSEGNAGSPDLHSSLPSTSVGPKSQNEDTINGSKLFRSKSKESPLASSTSDAEGNITITDPYDFVPSQVATAKGKVYGRKRGRPAKQKDPITTVAQKTEGDTTLFEELVDKTKRKAGRGSKKKLDCSVLAEKQPVVPEEPKVCEIEPVLYASQPTFVTETTKRTYSAKNLGKSKKAAGNVKSFTKRQSNESHLEEQFEALKSRFNEIETHGTKDSEVLETRYEDQDIQIHDEEMEEVVQEPEPASNKACRISQEKTENLPDITRVTFALDSETQDLEQLSLASKQKDYTQNLLLNAATSESSVDTITTETVGDQSEVPNSVLTCNKEPESEKLEKSAEGSKGNLAVEKTSKSDSTKSFAVNEHVSLDDKAAETSMAKKDIPEQPSNIPERSVNETVSKAGTESNRTPSLNNVSVIFRRPQRPVPPKAKVVPFQLVGTLHMMAKKKHVQKRHTPFKLLGSLDKERRGVVQKKFRDAEAETEESLYRSEDQTKIQRCPHVINVQVQTEKLSMKSAEVQTVLFRNTTEVQTELSTKSIETQTELVLENSGQTQVLLPENNTPETEGIRVLDESSDDDFFGEVLAAEKRSQNASENLVAEKRSRSPPQMENDAASCPKRQRSTSPSESGSGTVLEQSLCEPSDKPSSGEVSPPDLLMNVGPTQVNENLPKSPSQPATDEDGEDLFSPTPDKKKTPSPALATSSATSSVVNRPSLTWAPKPTIVCSGLTRAQIQQVTRLSSLISADILPAFNTSVTHVIVRTAEDNTAERTYKYLCGVAAKKWVLNFDWVKDCLSFGGIVDEEKYQALDMDLAEGPRRARLAKQLLFQDFEFCCVGPFTDVSVPEINVLLGLTGALVIEDPALFTRRRRYQLVVVQNEGDDEHPVHDWLKKYQVATVSREWVIDCIACYTLQPIRPNLVVGVSNADLIKLGFNQKVLDAQTSIP